MIFFLQSLVSGVMMGMVYGLMGLGIVVIYKATGIFNFAHGAILATMTFLAWSFIMQMHFPFWLMLIALFLVAVGVGLLIQRLVMQKLIGQPILAAIIATLALMEVFDGFVTLIWPGVGRGFPEMVPIGGLHIGGVAVSYESITNFIICLGAFGVLMLFFQRTKTGLAMRATAEGHQLARSEGIKVKRVFAISWILGVLFASIGGLILGHGHGVLPRPLFEIGMKAMPVVILGGLESFSGAILAGLIIGVGECMGAAYLDPYVGGGLESVLPYIIMLAVLILFPFGLFGYKKIERV
jgi:branched-chain amino acid transport system permease protein